MDKAAALIEVLKEHGVHVPTTGNVECLFHSDTSPSMSLDRSRGLYNCFSCGRGGDVYSLLQEWQGMSFEEARDKIEGGGNMQATMSRPLEQDAPSRIEPINMSRVEHLESQLQRAEAALAASTPGQGYVASRGLTEATARYFRLGLGTPEMGRMHDKLVVPYLGPGRKPLSIRSRCIEDHDHAGHGKYEGSAGERTRMFNSNALLDNPTVSEVHVTEGEVDAMSLHQCGLVAVGFPGVNNIKPHHLTILRGFDNVYLWCDNDNPGREMSDRLMQALSRAQPVHLPMGDVNSTLVAQGTEGVLARIGRTPL